MRSRSAAATRSARLRALGQPTDPADQVEDILNGHRIHEVNRDLEPPQLSANVSCRLPAGVATTRSGLRATMPSRLGETMPPMLGFCRAAGG